MGEGGYNVLKKQLLSIKPPINNIVILTWLQYIVANCCQTSAHDA